MWLPLARPDVDGVQIPASHCSSVCLRSGRGCTRSWLICGAGSGSRPRVGACGRLRTSCWCSPPRRWSARPTISASTPGSWAVDCRAARLGRLSLGLARRRAARGAGARFLGECVGALSANPDRQAVIVDPAGSLGAVAKAVLELELPCPRRPRHGVRGAGPRCAVGGGADQGRSADRGAAGGRRWCGDPVAFRSGRRGCAYRTGLPEGRAARAGFVCRCVRLEHGGRPPGRTRILRRPHSRRKKKGPYMTAWECAP